MPPRGPDAGRDAAPRAAPAAPPGRRRARGGRGRRRGGTRRGGGRADHAQEGPSLAPGPGRTRLDVEAAALDGHPRGSPPPRNPLRRLARSLPGIQLHWSVNSYTTSKAAAQFLSKKSGVQLFLRRKSG